VLNHQRYIEGKKISKRKKHRLVIMMAKRYHRYVASLRIERYITFTKRKISQIVHHSCLSLSLNTTQLIDKNLAALSLSLLVVVATLLYTSLWPGPWDFLVAWTKNNSIENQNH